MSPPPLPPTPLLPCSSIPSVCYSCSHWAYCATPAADQACQNVPPECVSDCKLYAHCAVGQPPFVPPQAPPLSHSPLSPGTHLPSLPPSPPAFPPSPPPSPPATPLFHDGCKPWCKDSCCGFSLPAQECGGCDARVACHPGALCYNSTPPLQPAAPWEPPRPPAASPSPPPLAPAPRNPPPSPPQAPPLSPLPPQSPLYHEGCDKFCAGSCCGFTNPWQECGGCDSRAGCYPGAECWKEAPPVSPPLLPPSPSPPAASSDACVPRRLHHRVRGVLLRLLKPCSRVWRLRLACWLLPGGCVLEGRAALATAIAVRPAVIPAASAATFSSVATTSRASRVSRATPSSRPNPAASSDACVPRRLQHILRGVLLRLLKPCCRVWRLRLACWLLPRSAVLEGCASRTAALPSAHPSMSPWSNSAMPSTSTCLPTATVPSSRGTNSAPSSIAKSSTSADTFVPRRLQAVV
ncbi:hypothetical protein AB1Y20_010065 [Prymnesium parvum]|uniref:Uncharacterized protein n=1 Tax=Prymnesium parvum TaxID=97485 RepID=A0AB34K672_PRYPA